jgi:VanZ family protein
VSPSTRRMLVAWIPAILYMALIWAVSSMSAPEFPVRAFPFRDKGVHAVLYAGLALLVAHACLRSFEGRARIRIALVACFVTIMWGFLDEVHQAFVPGRSSDVLDLLADGLGAVVGAGTRFAMGAVVQRMISRPPEGPAVSA